LEPVQFIIRHPLISALLVTLASLAAGICSIIMADFGGPLWAYVPLLLWLGTVGLPATAGVLLVAAAWGGTPLLSGLEFFAIVAAIVALAFQACFFVTVSSITRRHHR
jgi:hypothetical protein